MQKASLVSYCIICDTVRRKTLKKCADHAVVRMERHAVKLWRLPAERSSRFFSMAYRPL